MLNDRIQNIPTLQEALARAEDFLSKLPLATPYSEFEFQYDLSPLASYPYSYLLANKLCCPFPSLDNVLC